MIQVLIGLLPDLIMLATGILVGYWARKRAESRRPKS